jgi:hypothetical protein
MDNVDRLRKMYEYAIEHSLCKNKKEFAALIGVHASNLSKAFGCESGFLTDKFLLRVNQSIGNAFSVSWVLYGEGDMFAQSAPAAPEQEVSVSTNQPVQELVVSSDSARVRELEYVIETQKKLIDMLERENEDLKKENYYVSVRAKNA